MAAETTELRPPPGAPNSDERKAFLKWALADFVRFCSLLQIQPKEGGGRIPFILSPIQRAYNRARTDRDIILKPRQVFMTTLECARDLWWFLTKPGARVVIVVQSMADQSAYKDVAYKFRLFIDSLRRVGMRLEFSKDALGEWEIASRDSTMRIIQSGASEASARKKGRAGTANRVHISEAAFFEHAELTFSALIASVADTNTEVVIESTANGAAGWYFEQWQKAVNKKSRYTPHFFRWWDHVGYSAALAAGERVEPETDAQRALLEQGVTAEQLKFLQLKIGENGNDKTAQEYPSDPATCFLVSGRCFFDKAKTDSLHAKAQTTPPEHVERGGQLRIWKLPEPTCRYAITVDPSEGTGGDPGAAVVYDRKTGEHVATLHGQFPPWELAEVVATLGIRYNRALVVVERNNHGHAVLEALEHIEVKTGPHDADKRIGYPNIYQAEDEKLGWLSTEVSRVSALDALEAAHRTGEWVTPDVKVTGEMLTFVVNKKGKAEAAAGAHDDLVMATAIMRDVLSHSSGGVYVPKASSNISSRFGNRARGF